MKPRKLKIKGLNSFKEEQVIDFERLTEKGFFGIFGPTGCGKSSILDAITYALYGKITRDNTGFINVSEESMEITYEFEVGLGKERKIYVVDRAAKKDPKKGGYKSTVTRLSERIEDNLTILADKKSEVDSYITQIVGLTMEDFTRAVVLPQGKFSEFLKTAPSDRRDMLERIFALYKYGRGLGDKIKSASRENKEKLSVLSGKLSQYEGVSEEALLKLKEELEVLVEEEKTLREEKCFLDEQFEKYKVVWELQQELKLYEEKLVGLLNMQENIKSKKQITERGRAALKVKPFIDNLREIDGKFVSNKKDLMILVEGLKQLSEKLSVTEKKYVTALEVKDKNIPILVEKEANLKQAIELEILKKQREDERKVLVEEYKKISTSKTKLEEELKLMTIDREKRNIKLAEIEKNISDNRIEPEFRERLSQAYIKEKDYKKTAKNKEELEKRITVSIKELKEDKYKYEGILKNQAVKNQQLDKQKNTLEELHKNCPGDNAVLFEKLDILNKLKKYCSDGKAEEGKRQQILTRLISINKEEAEINDSIDSYNKKIISCEEDIKNIQNEIDNIKNNNLASTLASKLKEGDSCPVCGSEHFVHLAEAIEETKLKEYENKKVELEGCREGLKAQIQQNQIKKARVESEINHVSSELQIIEGKFKEISLSLNALNIQSFIFNEHSKLNSVNPSDEEAFTVDLLSLEKLVEDSECGFSQLRDKVEKWNNNVQVIEKEVNQLKEEKSNIDADAAKLGEGIKKDEKNIELLKSEHTKIVEEFKELEEEFNKLKEELKIDNIAERYNKLIELDNIMKSLQEEEKKLRASIGESDKLREKKELEKNELNQEETKVRQSGIEKKNAIEDYQKQIDRLCQGKVARSYIEEVQKEIKHINDEEALLKKELEDEKREMQSIQEKKAAAEQNRDTLCKLREEQDIKLKECLIENCFKAVEEAEVCILDLDTLEALEGEIKGYEEQLSNTKNTFNNIKSKINGDIIEEEPWRRLQEDRGTKAQLLDGKLEAKIKKNKELADMDESLCKIKELAKEQKELEHKESLLKELEKLVQGNKLVEFVATSQLRYVAAEASKRLKDITRGRYALELDDSGCFIMRDDFNGGLRRSTNSLSGGETFLTSLALALALSSQIQLKGRTPLEFFFLDEGFGTLDNELLDTVMTSLESLRSDRLCVGIISHVEEIKNRVPIKLIVTPAELGEGTKVIIEKS